MNHVAVRGPRQRTRLTAISALAAAGAFLAAYPALRPYSDETTLAGADAMASTAWVAAHSLGMVGFITLTMGAWALHRLGRTPLTGALLALTWSAVSLVLPYYGAETFGLQVIAERAVADQDTSLLALAETFRYGAAPMAFFATGLLLLTAAGVVLALAVRRAAPLVRVGGWLAGAALATYLPQFFLHPGMRIGHGAVLAVGLALLAAGLRRDGALGAEPAGRAVVPAAVTA